VIFLDAVPLTPPTLSVEVLTPHGPGSGAPVDAGNPVPVGFLAVKEDVTLRFAILPSTTYSNLEWVLGATQGLSPHEQARIDVGQVADWLTEAVGRIGIGAKTKSGYGRFRP
jgi:CRISPR type III-B/RAMP module RAMP protein Cmr6